MQPLRRFRAPFTLILKVLMAVRSTAEVDTRSKWQLRMQAGKWSIQTIGSDHCLALPLMIKIKKST